MVVEDDEDDKGRRWFRGGKIYGNQLESTSTINPQGTSAVEA